jgi:hypothetical protein
MQSVDTKMKSAHWELSKTVPTDFIDPVEAEIRFVSDLYESWKLHCKFQIIRHFSPVKLQNKNWIEIYLKVHGYTI